MVADVDARRSTAAKGRVVFVQSWEPSQYCQPLSKLMVSRAGLQLMSRIVLFKEFYWSTVDLQCLLISAVQQSDSVKVALVVKNLPANAGDLRDMSSIPEAPPGRSPGEGNGYPLQYSCLENPMDRGAWWATILGFSESVRHDLATKQ